MSELAVAVITNGSVLCLPEVRKELRVADAVLPSLDAGTESMYATINRRHPDSSYDRHVDGLMAFRSEYEGRLWLEVMLLGGVNDSPEALEKIAGVLERVEPDEIHISTPTQPPAEPWVKLPSSEGLEYAFSLFRGVARVLQPVEVDVETGIDGEIVDAIQTIVSRHPLQESEVVRTLTRWAPGQALEILSTLADSSRIRIIKRLDKPFWCAADTQFPDQTRGGHQNPGTQAGHDAAGSAA